MVTLFIILAVLWTLWGAAAVLSAISVRKCARRYERTRPNRFADYRPPAAVVVPFKGLDLDLSTALANLCRQDYPDYRLICVVESEDDPACAVLRDELARHPQCRSTVLVAGRSGPHEGQKVHNLRHAIAHLSRPDDPAEVWAFADSDAVPGTRWLAELVGPLRQHWVTGITTGYRWMVPPRDAGLVSHFWSHLASVINSSVACFYGYDRFNHAWGGSMAMRRVTALEGELDRHLRGALSDDYQATRMCRSMLLRVYFVPRCLVATPVDYDARGFFNFAQRQYVITRTHAPRLYFAVLRLLAMHFVAQVTAWAALALALCVGPRPLAVLPLLAIVTVFVANQCRATFRRRAVRQAFGDAMVERLRTTLRLDRWGTTLWMTAHLAVALSGLLTRTIDWRGRRYRIDGPQKIQEC